MKQKFPVLSGIQNGFSPNEILIVLALIVMIGSTISFYMNGHQKLYKTVDQQPLNNISIEIFSLSIGSLCCGRTGSLAASNKDTVATAAANDELSTMERYNNKFETRIRLAASKVNLPRSPFGTQLTPVKSACGKKA